MKLQEKTILEIEQLLRFLERKKVQNDRDVSNYIEHSEELERRKQNASAKKAKKKQ